jgi:hypothetical protein
MHQQHELLASRAHQHIGCMPQKQPSKALSKSSTNAKLPAVSFEVRNPKF